MFSYRVSHNPCPFSGYESIGQGIRQLSNDKVGGKYEKNTLYMHMTYKKVRKKENALDQESVQEKKKKLSFFLNRFLGRERVFLSEFSFSWASSFFS